MNPSEDNIFGEEEAPQKPDTQAASKKRYFQTIGDFQSICAKLKKEDVSEVECDFLKEDIDGVIELIKEDKRMLLGLANAPYPCIKRKIDEQVYSLISIHGVNVMIYSLMISMELGVPPNRLPYIGVAALCSRLGLLDAPEDMLNDASKLDSDPELLDKEKHAQKYIDKIKIENFHMESIGFLINFVSDEKQVLKGTSLHDAIHQYAMVIHICSGFEKLTHQKTYGEVFSPVEAMKKMRDEMRDCFNQDIIKLFFNKLSIYPLGSFVKLSTRETAKIVGLNDSFIMRPIVLVVLDSEGREKPEPVRINLREKPNIYIKKAIVDEFLSEKYLDVF